MGDATTWDDEAQVVLTRDQHDPADPLVRRRITRMYQRTAYALQILAVRDENGVEQTLKVTEEHPFYRESDGWTPARKLDAGDIILGADGALTVASNAAEQHPGGVTIYNLEVEQAHTYFVLAEHADDAAAIVEGGVAHAQQLFASNRGATVRKPGVAGRCCRSGSTGAQLCG